MTDAKVCTYCNKEFTITAEEQKKAREKGGKIYRAYCRECLLRWRKGEITLDRKENV